MDQATKGGYAVGAFNVFNDVTARAVVGLCERQNAPVILQTSVKTVAQIGTEELIAMVRPLAEKARVPVALHLDHCKDADIARRCIDAGWSSIMYDGSSLPFSENVANTKEIVRYARQRGVSVEGELGAIAGVEEDIVVDDANGSLADVDLSVQFTEETGVDAFAPAIGTAHGLYKGEVRIDFKRFADIRSKVKTNLVVHGGTGLSDDVFRRLIALGAAKINVSTAIKIAYLRGMTECGAFTEPLEADQLLRRRVEEAVARCVRVFGCAGKA